MLYIINNHNVDGYKARKIQNPRGASTGRMGQFWESIVPYIGRKTPMAGLTSNGIPAWDSRDGVLPLTTCF